MYYDTRYRNVLAAAILLALQDYRNLLLAVLALRRAQGEANEIEARRMALAMTARWLGREPRDLIRFAGRYDSLANDLCQNVLASAAKTLASDWMAQQLDWLGIDPTTAKGLPKRCARGPVESQAKHMMNRLERVRMHDGEKRSCRVDAG